MRHTGAGERLYTVTELGRELGVTARTLRFYEDKALIAPRRGTGGTRVYSHRDRARMILVLRGKRLGFSLREIKRFLDLYDADVTQEPQLRLLLEGVAERVRQLEHQREAIETSLAELRDIERQAHDALRVQTRSAA